MPQPEAVTIDLTGIQPTDASTGQPVQLAALGGVRILLLLRHRH
jgi:hypothetical protein